MKVKELLSDESKWIKACLARDKDGHAISHCEDFPKGVSFCIMGALIRCYSRFCISPYVTKIMEKLSLKYPTQLIEWNNATERTFEEVKALVEELDI